jgi:hypothetical protein
MKLVNIHTSCPFGYAGLVSGGHGSSEHHGQDPSLPEAAMAPSAFQQTKKKSKVLPTFLLATALATAGLAAGCGSPMGPSVGGHEHRWGTQQTRIDWDYYNVDDEGIFQSDPKYYAATPSAAGKGYRIGTERDYQACLDDGTIRFIGDSRTYVERCWDGALGTWVPEQNADLCEESEIPAQQFYIYPSGSSPRTKIMKSSQLL